MVKGLKSFERIQELLGELEVEMNNFFSSKEEHYEEVREFDLFSNDVRHLVEDVSLSASESARLIKRYREALQKRREMKIFIEMHASTQNDLRTLRRSLEKSKELMDETKDSVNVKNNLYRVRTKNMLEFMETIPNVENRTKVKFVPVTNEDLKEQQAKREVVKEKKKVSQPVKVSQPIKVETAHHLTCNLSKHGSKWMVQADGVTISESTNFAVVLDFVMESNYTKVLVSPGQRAVVKKSLERIKAKLKKGKTFAYSEKLNDFHQSLSA